MASVFFMFFVELFAFRWGTARLKKSNPEIHYDPHSHGPDPDQEPQQSREDHNSVKAKDAEASSDIIPFDDPDKHGTLLESHPLGQVLSVLILEFGVLFHSFIIGLTLAVSLEFIPLLCVLVFHQLFEGLGLGTRLAYLTIFTSGGSWAQKGKGDVEAAKAKGTGISKRYAIFPWLGALVFSLSTPLGTAIGLGVQRTYSPESTTASIVAGVFDSFSSGILLYTGLVELLAHEFLFSKTMMEKNTAQVALAGVWVLVGAGLMALLGKWA